MDKKTMMKLVESLGVFDEDDLLKSMATLLMSVNENIHFCIESLSTMSTHEIEELCFAIGKAKEAKDPRIVFSLDKKSANLLGAMAMLSFSHITVGRIESIREQRKDG